jgi:hypothetical protein
LNNPAGLVFDSIRKIFFYSLFSEPSDIQKW